MQKSMRMVLGILLAMVLAAGSGGCGMISGALLGGIIGYQSEEALAGALIGGAIGGAGEIASAICGMSEPKECHWCKKVETCTTCQHSVVVHVVNNNGSYTPVNLTRRGNDYIGPRGEYYHGLPSQDQLRPVYGL